MMKPRSVCFGAFLSVVLTKWYEIWIVKRNKPSLADEV